MPDPTPLEEARAAAEWNGAKLAEANAEIARLRQALAASVRAADDHDRRVTELLVANNREVERRRAAEIIAARACRTWVHYQYDEPGRAWSEIVYALRDTGLLDELELTDAGRRLVGGGGRVE